MQELAAVRSVSQAARMLKRMKVQAREWGDRREASRQALAHAIQERMHGLLGNRPAELEAAGVADWRNGTCRRRLLRSLGPIGPAVPRTR